MLAKRFRYYSIIIALLVTTVSFPFNGYGQVLVDDAMEIAALGALYESTNGDSWDSQNDGVDTNASTVYEWFGTTRTDNTAFVKLNGDPQTPNLSSFANYPYSAFRGEMSNPVFPSLTIYSSIYRISGGGIDDALELAALRSIFETTGGTNWISQNDGDASDNWAETTAQWAAITSIDQVKDWFGITVEFGDIVELDLEANNLSGGTMPTELGDLTGLTALILNDNALNTLPLSIGNLQNLLDLRLDRNDFTIFPAEVLNLTSLLTLGLRFNDISSIPDEIDQLTTLENLYLESNIVLSAVPSRIGGLVNLKGLTLSNTSITSLPETIGDLGNLEVLTLRLTPDLTSLPDRIGDLSELISFTCSSTQLTKLPDSFQRLQKLTYLAIWENSNFRVAPDWLADLESLVRINMYQNDLRSFPNFSNHLNKEILRIRVEKNHLDHASIAKNLSGTDTYVYQQFDYLPQKNFNYLPDEIDVAGDCAEIITNDRDAGPGGSYQWRGRERSVLPSSSGPWSDLTGETGTTLQYSNYPQFDQFICSSTNTKVSGGMVPFYSSMFDVTGADGAVPDGIELAALRALYESTGNLKGLGAYYVDGDPEGWTNKWPVTHISNWGTSVTSVQDVVGWHGITVECGDITNITMLNNNLHGSLPTEIGNLQELNWLSLNKNYIDAIPSSIGQLSKLTYLSLNDNLLTSIPIEIQDLAALSSLLLQHNQLTTVPDFTGMSALANLRLDFNQLASAPDISGTSIAHLGLGFNSLTEVPSGLTALPIQTLYLGSNLITEISLAQVNIPTLTLFTFYDNLVTSFPDLTGLAGAVGLHLWINDNYLNFADIESNYGVFNVFQYAPQKDFGDLPLDCNTENITNDRAGGVNTQYQWLADYGDDQWVEVGSTPNLMKPYIYTYNRYRCSMTNTLITDLILNSSTFVINIDEGDVPDLTEIATLQALYESTGNLIEGTTDYYTDNTGGWINKWPVVDRSSWSSLTLDEISSWDGIFVRCGDIASLTLNNNNLQGDLPTEIGNLSSLRSLSFAWNAIESVPTSIGDLDALFTLQLNGNSLTNLPATISDLDNLLTLYADYNQLTSIPTSFGSFQNLGSLILDNNLLESVPSSLMNISTLEFLFLSDNNLNALPGFETMDLTFLGVANNYLTFSRLEPYFSAPGTAKYTLYYSPQKDLDLTTELTCGEVNIINDISDGLYTNYQWYGDGVSIPGEQGQDMVIKGHYRYREYQCTMTNNWVTGLTLKSSKFTRASTSSPTITPSGPLNICSDPVILTIPVSYGTFQWYIDGSLIAGATNNTYAASLTGTYTVIGCGYVSTNPVFVQQYSVPNVTTQVTPATCSDFSDGEATVSITGGSGSFSYELRDAVNTPIQSGTVQGYSVLLSDLGTGNYNVIITDQVSPCDPVQRSFSISNGGPIASICASSPVCSALPDGSADSELTITVNRLRGNSGEAYSYIIRKEEGYIQSSGVGFFNQEISPKPKVPYIGENYIFEVLNGQNNVCSPTPTNINITPASLSIALDHPNGIYEKCATNQRVDVILTPTFSQSSCSSLALNSHFDVIVTKDDQPFRTLLFQSAPITLDDLTAGNYKATVIGGIFGGGNCSATTTFSVSEALLTVEVDVTNPACNDPANDGRAVARVTGGARPYQYKWFQGTTLISTLSSVGNLTPGNYRLEVLGQSCMVPYVEQFDIMAPTSVGNVSIQPPVTNCDMSATLANAGGAEPYDFYWVMLEEVERTAVFRNPTTGELEVSTFIDIVENVVFIDENVPASAGQAISYTTSDVVKNGNYIVRVRDAKNCEVESPQTNIEQPQFTRDYNLCFRWKTPAFEVADEPNNAVVVNTTIIESSNMRRLIEAQAEACMVNQIASFGSALKLYCYSLDYLNDEVTLQYNMSTYHHTLYYYDRADNLVRTVPPKGVTPLTALNATRDNTPAHQLVTMYDYNSIGQLVRQSTPDAGQTRFAYNNLGQLRFSQNAEQALPAHDEFSYTKYDALGRIVEVGEAHLGVDYMEPDGSTFPANTFADLESEALLDVDKRSYRQLPVEDRFPTVAQTLTEQTITTYSEPDGSITYNGQGQEYLRNRVSKTTAISTGGEEVNTYFSYDPHGNVEWLTQSVPGLGTKQLGYDYDLISGNVLKVKYNEGQADQFFHKYDYDEDNRIKSVATSTDGIVWDQDAAYSYYDHGPLAKMTVGSNQVQDVEYTYTLHGWLKAINDPTDGVTPVNAGKDAFSMLIGYYEGDFKNDNSPFNGSGSNPDNLPAHTGHDLYNGNISTWQLGTRASDNTWMRTGFQYTYDKLNRIRSSEFNVKVGDDFLKRGGFMADFTLDPNGNLETLNRNDIDNDNIDALEYTLVSGTNRLSHVDDLSTIDPAKQSNDLEDQNSGNYDYDATGNLIRDNQEQMDIEWTVYGKVDKITKADGSSTQFLYDAAGNRVKKLITDEFDNTNTHYYLRDASGNTMAVYKEENTSGPSTPELREIPIYGSDRLGIYTPEGAFTNNQQLVSTVSAPTTVNNYEGVSYQVDDGASITLQPGFSFEEGVDGSGFSVGSAAATPASTPDDVVVLASDLKQYELKDHLGNIRAVVTDKKLGTANGASFDELRPSMVSAAAYYPYGMDMPTVMWGEDMVSATLEPAEAPAEIVGFDNYAQLDISPDPVFNHTPGVGNGYSFRVTGENGKIIGLAKSLRVQAGDKVSASVFGKYLMPDGSEASTDIAASLADAFLGAFGFTAAQEVGTFTDFFSDWLGGTLTLTKPDDPSGNNVIAGINCLVFDENFTFIDGGFQLLTAAAVNDHEELALAEYTVPKDGYVFIYTSNESPQVTQVHFDDMTVTLEKLVPDAAYDPDLVAYRYGFNGKEKDQQGEWGLNHYDYGFRIYNPALARFLSVDPLTKSYPWYTPYQFAGNMPIESIDRDGLEEYHYVLTVSDQGESKVQLNSVVDITEKITSTIRLPQGWQDPGEFKTVEVTNRIERHLVTYEYPDYDVTEVLAIPVIRRVTMEFDSEESALSAQLGDFFEAIENEAMWRAFRQGFASSIGGGRPSSKSKPTIRTPKSGPNPAGKPRRPYLRESTINETWRLHENEDGSVIDPSGAKMFWDRSKPRGEQWHMGHKPGKEYWRDWKLFQEGKLTWTELKERYNKVERYRPELPETNQSHKYEQKE